MICWNILINAYIISRNKGELEITKQDFKSRVKGLFSVRWLKNDGSEGYIHRGILGTTKIIDGEHKEHDEYVLVYKVGNGYGDVRKWANVNPNTITHVNGVIQQW